MQFGILGPVEARDEGQQLRLGGPKQRALLAFLLLHANEHVTRDRLIEALWGEQPPASAGQSLDSYVSRLRKLLQDDRLTRNSPGYVLRVEPGELDLDRFEQLAGGGRYADALALWRGPALADLLYVPFANGAARDLEERRISVLERRIESELDAGSGSGLVSELERLVRENPLRERLIAQLSLALYRAGRQADALAVLRDARHRLAEDLGLSPGPELRDLEQRILEHDRGLRAGRGRNPAVASPRHPRIFAAVAVVLAAAAIIGVAVALSGGASALRLTGDANRLLAFGTGSGELLRAQSLVDAPGAATFGAGSVWVTSPDAGDVLRIDPRSGTVVDRITVGGEPGSIVSGAGAVWAASTLGATISRIDPATDAVTQTIALGAANPVALTFGAAGLWAADATDQALLEIDPANGSVKRTISLDLEPSALAAGAGAIWVAGYNAGTVEEIDPSSGLTLETLHVGNGPGALSFGLGALWVANNLDGTVSRIDPESVSVAATIPVGRGPSGVMASGGSVWVTNEYGGTVSRINPRHDAVIATIAVHGRPDSLAAAKGRVWVGAGAIGSTHRGGTLTLMTTGSFASIDPALYNDAEPPQFIGLAYDTLVTFQHTAGPDGLRLVPDLALQVPTPNHNGTTYVFRLRPGIRYSDGRPLLAVDFRRAIERDFRLGSPGTDYYSNLVGAAACRHAPRACDLSRGIVADDATGTIVYHLTSPDPDFLFKLTEYVFSAPIPAGVPDHDVGSDAVSGTGPYRIVKFNRHGAVFARNPYFVEWSHAAQPSGNPDVIRLVLSRSHQATVAAIEAGRADWTFDLIPPAELRGLELSHPSQLHSNPALLVEFIHLNTRMAPFNDLRVRQALNFALDRRKLVGWYGGPTAAAPTCQPLMPDMPGYVRYCPYTLHPRGSGVWSGPDLVRARQLVVASGTQGDRIDVWGTTDEVAIPRQEPAYVAALLRSLGFRTHLHMAPFAAITPGMRRRHQLSVDGDWIADYPQPSSYVPQFFSCGGGNGNGYYCDPRLDREMHQATVLRQHDPKRADALWTAIDHHLTDQAAWAPTVDLRAVELTSQHLRNYQFNPVWGFLADQVWLR